MKSIKGEVQVITAPSVMIEAVGSEKPAEFLSALSAYRRITRNAQRSAAPLTYLTQQASYAFRIYSALKAEGQTSLFVKSDLNGNWEKLQASRLTFSADYPLIVQALFRAQGAGVEVARAEIKTSAKGEYVRISAVGGIIGVA